ncbi:MAG: hypothetical protein QF752_08215 [Planctomycetota bacterium]|nr:hypothetical protein [Planctomycetota bacterium]
MSFDPDQYLSPLDRALALVLLRNRLVKEDWLALGVESVNWCRRNGVPFDLGSFLVEQGFLGEGQVESGRKLANREVENPLCSSGSEIAEDHRIGQLAILNGFIEPVMLDEAVEIQSKIRELGVEVMIGKILVDKSFLSKELLVGLLQMQRRPRRSVFSGRFQALREEDFAFGQLALDEGYVRPSDISEALVLQLRLARVGIQKRLGELLHEERFIPQSGVEWILSQEEFLSRNRFPSYVLDVIYAHEEDAVEHYLRHGVHLTQEQVLVAKTLHEDLANHGIERSMGQILADKRWLTRQDIEASEVQVREESTRRIRRQSGAHTWMLGAAVFLILAYVLAQTLSGRTRPGGIEVDSLAEDPGQPVEKDPQDDPIPDNSLNVLLEGVRDRAERFHYEDALLGLREIRRKAVNEQLKEILDREETRYEKIVELMASLRVAHNEDPRELVVDGRRHIVFIPTGGGLRISALSISPFSVEHPMTDRNPDGPLLSRLLHLYGLDVQRAEDVLALYLDRDLREEASRQAARAIRLNPSSQDGVLQALGNAWQIEDPLDRLVVQGDRVLLK